MSERNDRIIHSFAERLAVEQAVRGLGEATTLEEQTTLAVEIAQQDEMALNALLRQLDSDNSALRGGLGVLARQLDPALIIPALRRAAVDTRRPDAARLTAVMILERHLGLELDPELTRLLPDPSGVAHQSAVQALAMAEDSPAVLVEYAGQLLAEPPDTIQAVLAVIDSIDDPARARLLLAIASYADAALVVQIIPMLGAIRHPLALQSLRVLEHFVPANLQPAVQRQARKLQLAGVRVQPEARMRTLLSPINAQGQSLIWFIHQPASADHANLLALVLHDRLGILNAEAQTHIPLGGLPMPAPKRHVHRLRVNRSQYFMRMAEIEPALGLYLVQGALSVMADLELPWPSALIVQGHWLWGEDQNPEAANGWPDLPTRAATGNADDFIALLQHDAFAPWILDIAEIDALLAVQSPGQLLRRDDPLHIQAARHLVSPEMAVPLARRLRWQALWLNETGDTANASLSMAAQQAFEQGEYEHPFVNALAWRSLLGAADKRAQQRLHS